MITTVYNKLFCTRRSIEKETLPEFNSDRVDVREPTWTCPDSHRYRGILIFYQKFLNNTVINLKILQILPAFHSFNMPFYSDSLLSMLA